MAAQPPRQQPFIQPITLTRVRAEHVTILGAGGAGRQLALQLVSLGITKLTVVDPSRVMRRHLASEGYRTDDVGRPKVDCLGDVCHQAQPLLDYVGLQVAYRTVDVFCTSVFCCASAPSERKQVWSKVQGTCRYLCDVRLDGETLRILTATDESSRRRFATTLAREAAKVGRASPSLISTAGLAASLAVHQFTRYLSDLPRQHETTLNVATGRIGTLRDE
ncbi:MAG: ThiF family adenylyltransferase [Planctomycetales bacterium]|nr:ThiF family adenylyltransferase [Planctomycetales bacterium]